MKKPITYIFSLGVLLAINFAHAQTKGITPEMQKQAEYLRQMEMRCDKSIVYDRDAREDEQKMRAAAQKCKANSDRRTCESWFGEEFCKD